MVVWHTNDVNRNILQSVCTIVLHAHTTKLFRYTLWNSCNHRTLSILYGNNVSQFPRKNISTASVTIKALASNADHSSKMSHIHTAMPCQSPQKKTVAQNVENCVELKLVTKATSLIANVIKFTFRAKVLKLIPAILIRHFTHKVINMIYISIKSSVQLLHCMFSEFEYAWSVDT